MVSFMTCLMTRLITAEPARALFCSATFTEHTCTLCVCGVCSCRSMHSVEVCNHVEVWPAWSVQAQCKATQLSLRILLRYIEYAVFKVSKYVSCKSMQTSLMAAVDQPDPSSPPPLQCKAAQLSPSAPPALPPTYLRTAHTSKSAAHSIPQLCAPHLCILQICTYLHASSSCIARCHFSPLSSSCTLTYYCQNYQ